MITKFDSLFAGHIDMENAGYAGTAVNDRRFSNEQLASVFDKAQAMAELMDRVGYDTFWMAEHHFQHEGYECIPNVLMAALHLAHLTKNIKLGCGFNICPMWHPLRLAEDYATADILSGGRITFGVGRSSAGSRSRAAANGRSTSWPSTASRGWSAAARPKAARCTASSSSGRRRMPRSASIWNSASGCVSA